MQITVKIKSTYGKTSIYPACERSEGFARIANTKTLTNSAIKEIKALGFQILVDSDAMVSDLLTQ